jgi:hypothetical protein
MMSGVSEPDPTRGVALVAEARELTARIRETYRHLIATWFVEVLADDRQAAIRTLPEFVQQASSAGQPLLFVLRGRDLLQPLATFGRYDAVAVLDGAVPGFSIRPALAAEAVAAAREALGDVHYTDLYSKGRSFSPAELEEYLLQLASELS